MNRKVKSIMMLKGITSKAIAQKAGVSETWISLVINGRGTSARIRKAIADALGMTVSEIGWESPVDKERDPHAEITTTEESLNI